MKIIILYIALVFSLYSCKKNEFRPKQSDFKIENKAVKSIITDTTNINGLVFELIDNNGIAELHVKSDSINIEGKIKMSPPCYFVRYEKKLRKHQYPDLQVIESIMILGDTINSKDSSSENICGKALQGISLKNNNKVIISKGVIRTNAFCLDLWIDEKDFSGFASGLYDNNK